MGWFAIGYIDGAVRQYVGCHVGEYRCGSRLGRQPYVDYRGRQDRCNDYLYHYGPDIPSDAGTSEGFPGLWGTIVGGNNSEYDISLDLTGNNVGTASSLESTLLTEIRGALAGAELEFDADGQYARSLDGKVSEGAWQTDGDQLTLTVGNTSRVFTFKVKNTDLVELTTDLTSEVQAAYPDDGITSATLTFYVGRTILM